MGRVLTRNDKDSTDNEFELTDKDFKFIQWFMHKHAGIYFSDRKRTMVYGRVSRQLRRLGLKRFSDYQPQIEQDGEERVNFINSLTTNKTQFFREYHHFEFLEQVMLKEWKQMGLKDLSIWSAGCSTGEEPYSFVSSLNCAGAFKQFGQVSITATDLDTKVLAHAKQGIYSDEAISSIPEKYLKSSFFRGKASQRGNIKIAEKLQQFIRFKQLNLLEDWDFSHPFDLISCRNVMIYFDKPTQEKLIRRFHQQLKPNGVLFIGHSESAGSCSDLFRNLGKTIYVKQ
ncbi:CheR family methyltransferase [Vibrio ostreicida]|uniref:Chemotaxis protein methyltransferase n=1 Tax=Vibrio ostreicida TaxID=526588 RepID=A0ABT8C0M7_9VIBR|nr:protein-glutamate O-methyltransferase CheR [Vibrio ostreicida]MDN3612169.1 protein-glutamate O-methyltransferase CheR [Vibrio ostreicida]NPD08566.1 protein-glutamate O-methyltransferase CheR [Vibrio ostreicida]